ncbi:MAG TPA: DegV family protein [Ktedonobacterales bacterium]
MAIRILVDSTADIPHDRARSLGIEVVPLTVLFGDEAYRDGIDLDGPTFYQRLVTSPVTPTTSTPSPGLFDEAYRRLIHEGATGILSIQIASKLSGTFSAAQGAAEQVSQDTGVPIAMVDSGTVSAGYGLPAEIVAREAREGKSLAELKAHAESLCRRVNLFAVLDTLEFLRRGGRIGGAAAMLGTLLNVKPLVAVRDGEVVPLERVRTRVKAMERIGQLVAELGELEALAIVESDEASGAQLEAVARRVWTGPIEHSQLGPVVGTYGGPGAAGIVAITKG